MSFITDIAPHAQRIQKEYGILASLIIAQAIHESNWGKSGLAVKGKNLFGIKGTYNGQSATMKTWEVYGGKSVYVDAAFRKYPSWYESLCDLANLYKNGVSWDRNIYKKVIGEKDYKKAAKAVQTAGYATDPNYANKVINTIEANNLTKYDTTTVAPDNKKESKTKTHKVSKDTPGYLTAADARSGKNKKNTIKAGNYYVYNESDGMINVTTKAGLAGSWINPKDKNAAESKPIQSKNTVHLPASAETWRTYKLNVQPVKKNSDWSLTPGAFGGLTYEILGRPYSNVVTINTSRGKRNIYVGPETGAVIK